MPDNPAYLRIAAELRTAIVSGALGPGAKLPSETRLMVQYNVSRTVAKWAISVLKGEGLVEGRRGSGVYVRAPRRMVREAHGRDLRAPGGPTSPFARDAARAGRRGEWEHHSRHAVAGERVGVRLGVDRDAPVMCTEYRFLADGEPIQLSTSWEPLSLTAGTAVEWPEGGDGGPSVVGVVARMDAIGVRVDEFVERVTARFATTGEAQALRLPPRGGLVLAIERTYLAGGRPVETADIVIPGDRYELVYRVPVD